MTIDDKWLTVLLENQCGIMFALSTLLAFENRQAAERILEAAEATLEMMRRAELRASQKT